MLIFSVNGTWEGPTPSCQGGVSRETGRGGLVFEEFFTDMVRQLTEKYGNITSIFFLENTGRADIVTGNPIFLFGTLSITEELL